MTSRVPLLAKNLMPPTLELQNRFACLEDEQPKEFLWNPAPDVLPAEQPETTTSLTTLDTYTTENYGPLNPALLSPTQCPDTTQNLYVEEAIGRKAQVSNVTLDTDTTEHDLLRIEGKINGQKAWMLIDSSSTDDFFSLDFAQKNKLEIESLEGTLCVSLANGRNSHYPSLRADMKVAVGSLSERQTFMVIPLTNYDVISGKPWLFRKAETVRGENLSQTC